MEYNERVYNGLALQRRKYESQLAELYLETDWNNEACMSISEIRKRSFLVRMLNRIDDAMEKLEKEMRG